ncbi:MAG: mechanosensitive ion channel family protein [Asticcacaulis sp.]|uniref:mechanosensitive ion channel family protein n=1 Tax=Asticcacaulis sp. TaxID=1872648 RepID=UPI003F7C3ED4
MQHFDFGPVQSFLDTLNQQAQQYWRHLAEKPDFFANIGWAALILLITMLISNMASNAVKRAARRLVHKDGDRTLLEFFSQIVRWIVLVVGLVACLNRLGVQTASLLTVLGAASLAIGLALQGTLSNVAAGLMILLNKPYRIGDIIRVGEVQGTVHRLGVFATEINNTDSVRVFVPNTKVFSNEIINITNNASMKIELIIGVDYDSDLPFVARLLKEVADRQPDRLEAPEPLVGFTDFADSSINAKVLMWVLPTRALVARSALIMDIKAEFDKHGINIPFPHQVEVRKEPPAPASPKI